MTKAPRLTLIAGPTASGKSRLALDRARRTGAVIINADSQQLYADLRVLTARPSTEDEAAADHRLYGIADASEAWSVGQWSRAVLALLDELGDRPALLVGGTGLYFSALTQGLADIPPVPLAIRDQVQARFDDLGEAAFRRRLAGQDPASAAAITPGDRQRLVRAAAVAQATGRSLTEWKADTRPLLPPGSYERLVIEPERARLYANCDARVLQMMQMGALEEVRALVARDLDPGLPAMKAVGVPELISHLHGERTLAEAVAALQQATRNYAKRQLTWFRNQCRDWVRAR
ncbi:tRNA (adenosine(37)-N6)-dimethylallyltransferase MiaA [Brevundimonas vesicularis]|uniref:tRNA (adenosine(37)-N6)-dimethylallyltransferase MiaA n=1 Tax=Brevundimonas vesicularis TaxID=41276 RepID=UPI0038D35ED1